ncbi:MULTISPECIES: Crp/Fnr family transcriptional regulator [unclassified Methylobacterium]|jgi:CRP-like cAMP-binding protein|uniref:Crp/Fnr family transcriptional regulator n=1 Tax=unclassified Methylobacterium TaxID=2615210 RepID=UPI0006F9C1BC|nr:MULTISPECIES: Crp/Fnr family transcriptional regulator [unclassified Methylobacterium]KQO65387.1 Crp/Fnr family transcriptional regulator [Methylobacterium sp. Leaf88]KQO67967.1 Crp/Fnr family transcriptional regulator [Methylobacterium sp. Leaf89]KQP67498.1 Crp/Fnr family transcriptional regulator [Methylobacterium sp. Leaf111]KQT73739.1 Crp/Fnr family transcriptional regulator [Methylobacterium sp. Leaf465]KQU25837.1 Crp/Fnr family transcriptional regulator [Methylobacterium sp. Leaf94]
MSLAAGTDLSLLVRKLETIITVSDLERRAIERLPVTRRQLSAHQDIVRDGDHPKQCCLLLEGWAFRYKLLDEGKRQILSVHIPGDIPDLQSLHLPVMDHSLSTLTACTLAFIPHEAMLDLTRNHPGITAALWRDTLVDAAIFREWMTNIGRRSTLGRITHLFCEIYLKLHGMGLARDFACEMPLTQGDIADAIGVSNVHVNRVLQDLRGQGLLTLQGQRLVIHDWDALTNRAEFDPAYLHQKRPPGP